MYGATTPAYAKRQRLKPKLPRISTGKALRKRTNNMIVVTFSHRQLLASGALLVLARAAIVLTSTLI